MADERVMGYTEEPSIMDLALRRWAEDLRAKDPADPDATTLEDAAEYIEYLYELYRRGQERILELERRDAAPRSATDPAPLRFPDAVAEQGDDFEIALRVICSALQIPMDRGRLDDAATLVRKIVAVVPTLHERDRYLFRERVYAPTPAGSA